MSYTLTEKALAKLIEKDIVWDTKMHEYVPIKQLNITKQEIKNIVNNSFDSNDERLVSVNNRIKDVIYKRYYMKNIDNQKNYDSLVKKGIKPKFNRDAFAGNFNNFVIWWAENCDDNGHGPTCKYCGTNEIEYKKIFDNKINNINSPYISGKLHRSKKNSFNSPYMQIDKIDPTKGYRDSNCVFACALCNNSKSDLIEGKDFENTIGKHGIRKYIEELLKNC